MEKKLQSMQDTAQAVVDTENTEEETERVVNKVVSKALFLNAKVSKMGKLGITVMLIDGIDAETGQVEVTLEQKSIKGQNYTVSPVITAWVKNPSEDLKKFLSCGGLRDIVCIVSGVGEFRRIHKFLTKAEYDQYLALVG